MYALPAHSLKFAGNFGIVASIDTDDDLPVKVSFPGMRILYGFSPNELLTEYEYFDFLKTRDYMIIKSTGEVAKIKGSKFPSILAEDGREFSFRQVIPKTQCEYCGVDTSGEMSPLCEECRFPLPKEGARE